MSVIVQGYQLRELLLGTQVIKAATAFPQTATATLYTVTGGQILVTSFTGVVTTATTTDPVLTIGTAPTVGTADTDGIATTTALTSAELGTLITVQPSSGLGGALVVGSLAGSAVWLPTPFVVSAGTITLTTGASHAGKVDWYLNYIPLDTGASVS
jgi:hypothetical protein